MHFWIQLTFSKNISWTKIFEMFLEEVNRIHKYKKKYFLAFKGICVTSNFIDFQNSLLETTFLDIFYFLPQKNYTKSAQTLYVFKSTFFKICP